MLVANNLSFLVVIMNRHLQGRSQDVSLRGVSVRAKRARYAGTFLGERSDSVTAAAGEQFLGTISQGAGLMTDD